MLRKLSLVAVAAASLAATALAPTSASAFGGFHGGHGFHHSWGGPRLVARLSMVTAAATSAPVPTPWPHWRLVNRCY